MNEMTVYYRKSTGDLTDIVGGEQNMAVYGTLEADYALIYSFIVVDYDEYVFSNKNLFYITNGLIKLKDSATISKYL